MKRRKLNMNVILLIECMLYFHHQSISNQSFVFYIRIILFSWILLLPFRIIMTDISNTRDIGKIIALLIIWTVCLICIGVIICSLRCYICYSERLESRIVSCPIPDCPTNLDEEIDGQFEENETALWDIGVYIHRIEKKCISRFLISLNF